MRIGFHRATKKPPTPKSRYTKKENAMNATFRSLLGVLAAFALVLSPQFATAQSSGFRSAGEKISGEAYWPGRAAGRYIESARNYAQEYQGYVARAPRPEPAVVQEVSKTLNGYLDEANKHLAAMKKDFANDKETVAAVEAIEKDLAKAVGQHKEMVACCQAEKFDKAMAMTCCTDLAKDLGKIHDSHVALMKKLATKHAAK
jgi:hypothetical protein